LCFIIPFDVKELFAIDNAFAPSPSGLPVAAVTISTISCWIRDSYLELFTFPFESVTVTAYLPAGHIYFSAVAPLLHK
jgi:hypothetical protein